MYAPTKMNIAYDFEQKQFTCSFDNALDMLRVAMAIVSYEPVLREQLNELLMKYENTIGEGTEE